MEEFEEKIKIIKMEEFEENFEKIKIIKLSLLEAFILLNKYEIIEKIIKFELLKLN